MFRRVCGTLFATILLAAPHTAFLASPNAISSVSITDFSKAVINGSVFAVEIDFTVERTIAAGETLAFFFVDKNGKTVTDFDFFNAAFESATVIGEIQLAGSGSIFGVMLFNSISVGDHSISLRGIRTPLAERLGLRLRTTTENAEAEASDTSASTEVVDITESGVQPSNPGNVILATAASPHDPTAGAMTNYNVTLNFATGLPTGSIIYFYFEDGNGPQASEFSFADASFTSETIIGTFGTTTSDKVATITLSEIFTNEGDNQLVLTNVQNPSHAVESVRLWASTEEPADGANGVLGDEFTIFGEPSDNTIDDPTVTNDTAVGLSKPRKLKTKNIHQRKVRATWRAPSKGEPTKYRVQLRKCKHDIQRECTKKKHYQKSKKWKKFKNIKKQPKRIRKRRTFKKLEPATFYQWRVRAVNDARKSAFTKWKRFKTISKRRG